LNYLKTQYSNLVVEEFNIRDDAAIIEAMCERYGVPPEERLKAPAIFIGGDYLTAENISLPRLTALIEDAGETGSAPPWEGLDAERVGSAAAMITERFRELNVLAVAAAGLLDGINPCAFTTIIFFVSYLALVGRGKQDVLFVGAAFTLAVFLTYLAMGLGLSAVVERIGSIAIIGRVIYGGTALVCIALAILSLWDYVKIRRGQMTEILLQLPSVLKKRIHETIRTHSRMHGYVAAAFGAGIMVSVFELACTGQMYLPTIIFMTSVPAMRPSAIAYLILYNALFVVPLIAVFGVTYFGVSSRRLTAVFQANAGPVKLFTAALFGVLGMWLAYLLI
jgi:cytochrome c biogenesis protein CcdA